MTRETPCSVRSRQAGEPLAATASWVNRWILVEWDHAWGRDALVDSGLPPALARDLSTIDDQPRTKVLLIRRRLVGDNGPAVVVRARSAVADERLDRVRVERTSDIGEACLEEPAPGAGASEHLLAVCTNGRHDSCCATYGRPLVHAFHDLGVDPPVWECSHVGGDRFAGNVVVLPHGLYFGRVEPTEVDAFVADLRNGLLPLDTYRGRSALPPPAQAAEIEVRRSTGDRRRDALTGWHQHRVEQGRWQVRVDLAGASYEVDVTAHRDATPQLLTCHAGEPLVPRRFRCRLASSP